MSRSTGILCDWLNNSQTRYSPIRVFPQQLSNRQIGSSSNIKLRVQEGLNELGIVLLCTGLASRLHCRTEQQQLPLAAVFFSLKQYFTESTNEHNTVLE